MPVFMYSLHDNSRIWWCADNLICENWYVIFILLKLFSLMHNIPLLYICFSAYTFSKMFPLLNVQAEHTPCYQRSKHLLLISTPKSLSNDKTKLSVSSHLQKWHDDFHLILPEQNVKANFADAVNGIQTDGFYLIVEHVHQEVLRLVSKTGKLCCQFTQGIYTGITDLCKL